MDRGNFDKCLLESKSYLELNKIEISIEERDISFINTILIHSDDKVAFLYYFIGSILIGISSFGIKLTSQMFPQEFTSNGYLAWRSVSVMIISLLFIKINNEKLIRFSEVKSKKWFIIRTAGNYFLFLFFVLCMMQFRSTTASCISSINPIIVYIFSIFILKESFYIRYIIGLVLCIICNFMIILNERKANEKYNLKNFSDDNEFNDILRIIKGSIYGILHLLSCGFVIVGSKILATENITNNDQCFYIGLSNAILAFTASLFDGISINLFYVLSIFIFGFAFYSANRFFLMAMKMINLSKLSPLAYTNTLTVFLLAALFCGENIYITDIIGSLSIVIFNIYNIIYPVK